MNDYNPYKYLDMGKKLYDVGFEGKITGRKLLCLSRYCLFELGMKPKETKEFLLSKTASSLLDYNDKIDDSIKYAKKNGKLNGVEEVTILPHELQCISILENKAYQKLLFVMLVIAKRDGNNFYNYKKGIANILGKVRLKEIDLGDAGNYLNNKFPNCFNEKTFSWDFNNLPILESNYSSLAVQVADMLRFFPNFCDKCKNIYFKEKPRQKLCLTCSRENDLEKKRKWWNNNKNS